MSDHQDEKGDTPTEGWAFPTTSARKCHYFVVNRSLCGKYAYWSVVAGPLQQDTPGLAPGPDDCVACSRKHATPPATGRCMDCGHNGPTNAGDCDRCGGPAMPDVRTTPGADGGAS